LLVDAASAGAHPRQARLRVVCAEARSALFVLPQRLTCSPPQQAPTLHWHVGLQAQLGAHWQPPFACALQAQLAWLELWQEQSESACVFMATSFW